MANERLCLVTVNGTANYYVLINPEHVGGVRDHLKRLAKGVNATADLREVPLSNLDEIASNHFMKPPEPQPA